MSASKGFGIEIKNDLLEPKHVEAMGPSPVFLYMWFIDRMTSIGEDGIGKVLGGKPVVFEEVQQDLGITERTYRRWVNQLRRGGYINTTRTPRGLSFSVNKAFKRFGRKTDMTKVAHPGPATSVTSDRPKTSHRSDKSGTSNKTVSVDSTVRPTSKEVGRKGARVSKLEVDQVIKAFELMDYTLPSPTKQRRYASNLIKREGVEEVLSMLRIYYQHRANQFCPNITSPTDLYYNWDRLKQFVTKEKIKAIKPKGRKVTRV